MTKTPTIHIDFDKVLETLRKGVRRADVFMGIGVNASEHTPPISHLLATDKIQQIHLVKVELTDDEKAHVAHEFGKWSRANGLRELLETFSVFMHELYSIMFLIKFQQRQLDKKFNKCRPEKFERLGIGDQIKRISEVVDVIDDNVKIISSLNKARNCYAHRRGIVSALDSDEGADILLLRWKVPEIQIREPDGNVIPAEELAGRILENGGMVQLVMKARAKEFARGSELVLEKQELKEICLYILSVGQSLFKETVVLAREAGIVKEEIEANFDDPKAV